MKIDAILFEFLTRCFVCRFLFSGWVDFVVWALSVSVWVGWDDSNSKSKIGQLSTSHFWINFKLIFKSVPFSFNKCALILSHRASKKNSILRYTHGDFFKYKLLLITFWTSSGASLSIYWTIKRNNQKIIFLRKRVDRSFNRIRIKKKKN